MNILLSMIVMMPVMLNQPRQVLPSVSSTNPGLHLHTRDPGMLSQICKQSPLYWLHSLISIEWQ